MGKATNMINSCLGGLELAAIRPEACRNALKFFILDLGCFKNDASTIGMVQNNKNRQVGLPNWCNPSTPAIRATRTYLSVHLLTVPFCLGN